MAEEADFVGKVVSVWARDPVKGGVLENVRLRQLGDRTFLVGQMADDGKGADPRNGLPLWIAFDDVMGMIVYPDVQTARAAYAAWDRQVAADGPKRSTWPWRK
jgi:hypothetical protein